MKAYTYILECSDKTFYCGWTYDLNKRIKNHNEKKASKYTRIRTPVKLVYFEEYESKSEAMKREASIKKLKREEKKKLIANFFIREE